MLIMMSLSIEAFYLEKKNVVNGSSKEKYLFSIIPLFIAFIKLIIKNEEFFMLNRDLNIPSEMFNINCY